MKHLAYRWYPHAVLTFFLMLSLFFLVSCVGYQSSTQPPFYDAGDTDLTMTSSQFTQYILFRFDTATSNHTLTTPSAADIVASDNAAVVGDVIAFAVAADGTHNVTIIGGMNVIVKPSASIVAGNTTLMIYFEIENVNSGSQAVTIY
jgi:hypothetical protein